MSDKNHNWVDLPTAPNGAKTEMPIVPEEARAIASATPGAMSLPTELMAPKAEDTEVPAAPETEQGPAETPGAIALGSSDGDAGTAESMGYAASYDEMSQADIDSAFESATDGFVPDAPAADVPEAPAAWAAPPVPETPAPDAWGLADDADTASEHISDDNTVEAADAPAMGWTPPTMPDAPEAPEWSEPEMPDASVPDAWASETPDIPAPIEAPEAIATEDHASADEAIAMGWSPSTDDLGADDLGADDLGADDVASDAAEAVESADLPDFSEATEPAEQGWASTSEMTAEEEVSAAWVAPVTHDAPAEEMVDGGWTPPSTDELPEAPAEAAAFSDADIHDALATPELDAEDAVSNEGFDAAVPLMAADADVASTTASTDFEMPELQTEDDGVEGIAAFSPVEQEVPEAGSRKLVPMLLGLVALAAIAYGIFWFLNRDSGATDNATETPENSEVVGEPASLPNEGDESDNGGEPAEGADDGDIEVENELPVGPPPTNEETDPETETPALDLQFDFPDTVPETPEPADTGTGFRLTGVDADGNTVNETVDQVCLSFSDPVETSPCVSASSPRSTVAFAENGVIAVGGLVDDSVAKVELVFADGNRTNVPLTPAFGPSGRWFFTLTHNPADGLVAADRVELVGADGSVLKTVGSLDQL